MRYVAALLVAVLGGCASTVPETQTGETSIPYANSDGIVEWQAAGDDALYVRALTGGWYLLRTMGRCSALQTAVSLGFQTSALDSLDRHGAIVAGGRRCPLTSVTKVDGPPARTPPRS